MVVIFHTVTRAHASEEVPAARVAFQKSSHLLDDFASRERLQRALTGTSTNYSSTACPSLTALSTAEALAGVAGISGQR